MYIFKGSSSNGQRQENDQKISEHNLLIFKRQTNNNNLDETSESINESNSPTPRGSRSNSFLSSNTNNDKEISENFSKRCNDQEIENLEKRENILKKRQKIREAMEKKRAEYSKEIENEFIEDQKILQRENNILEENTQDFVSQNSIFNYWKIFNKNQAIIKKQRNIIENNGNLKSISDYEENSMNILEKIIINYKNNTENTNITPENIEISNIDINKFKKNDIVFIQELKNITKNQELVIENQEVALKNKSEIKELKLEEIKNKSEIEELKTKIEKLEIEKIQDKSKIILDFINQKQGISHILQSIQEFPQEAKKYKKELHPLSFMSSLSAAKNSMNLLEKTKLNKEIKQESPTAGGITSWFKNTKIENSLDRFKSGFKSGFKSNSKDSTISKKENMLLFPFNHIKKAKLLDNPTSGTSVFEKDYKEFLTYLDEKN